MNHINHFRFIHKLALGVSYLTYFSISQAYNTFIIKFSKPNVSTNHLTRTKSMFQKFWLFHILWNRYSKVVVKMESLQTPQQVAK